MNYIDNLDKTLKDRIPIIMVDGYTKSEKRDIANMHLIPNALQSIGLTLKDVTFTKDALDYIIDESNTMYTDDTKSPSGKSGVRQLKVIIINTIMKINMLRNCKLPDNTYGNLTFSYHIDDFKLPIQLTKEHIIKLKVISEKENNSYMSMYI